MQIWIRLQFETNAIVKHPITHQDRFDIDFEIEFRLLSSISVLRLKLNW